MRRLSIWFRLKLSSALWHHTQIRCPAYSARSTPAHQICEPNCMRVTATRCICFVGTMHSSLGYPVEQLNNRVVLERTYPCFIWKKTSDPPLGTRAPLVTAQCPLHFAPRLLACRQLTECSVRAWSVKCVIELLGSTLGDLRTGKFQIQLLKCNYLCNESIVLVGAYFLRCEVPIFRTKKKRSQGFLLEFLIITQIPLHGITTQIVPIYSAEWINEGEYNRKDARSTDFINWANSTATLPLPQR